ncbi:MAG: hypothetical protein LBJ96_00125 [Holosporaceae bacterium]|jgi:hypothetical protein|nr:hypothetical protein [Holosporaceae bacterium]
MEKDIMKHFMYTCLILTVVIVLLTEPAYCGITDAQIKAASKTFMATMKDWVPVIVGGGLFGSGVCLFVNNFKMGIAGLAGTGFLYAAKSFVGEGEGALIQTAAQLLEAAF